MHVVGLLDFPETTCTITIIIFTWIHFIKKRLGCNLNKTLAAVNAWPATSTDYWTVWVEDNVTVCTVGRGRRRCLHNWIIDSRIYAHWIWRIPGLSSNFESVCSCSGIDEATQPVWWNMPFCHSDSETWSRIPSWRRSLLRVAGQLWFPSLLEGKNRSWRSCTLGEARTTNKIAWLEFANLKVPVKILKVNSVGLYQNNCD